MLRPPEGKRKKRSLLLPVYTSILGVLLCMVCLSGSSWAWFTANQSLTLSPINASEMILDAVQVYQLPANAETAAPDGAPEVKTPVAVTMADGAASFRAEAGIRYAVDAAVKGTATAGFLRVSTCDGDFYSTELQSSFILLLSEAGTVMITASWGSETGAARSFDRGEQLGNGSLLECCCTHPCAEESIAENCTVCKAAGINVCTGTAQEAFPDPIFTEPEEPVISAETKETLSEEESAASGEVSSDTAAE